MWFIVCAVCALDLHLSAVVEPLELRCRMGDLAEGVGRSVRRLVRAFRLIH